MAATTAPDGRAGHQVGRSLHRLEAQGLIEAEWQRTADALGLNVLVENIEDSKHNITRFAVVDALRIAEGDRRSPLRPIRPRHRSRPIVTESPGVAVFSIRRFRSRILAIFPRPFQVNW